MFTADGLRPDSPHFMPPRGAAYVLSLALPRISRSRPATTALEVSLVLASSSVALSLLLAPVSRTRVVPSTCTLLSRCILLRSTSLRLSPRPCPRHGYPAASAKAGNSDRGSKSVLAERGRERERERTDSRKRQWHHGTREKKRDNELREQRIHAHDRLIHVQETNLYARALLMAGGSMAKGGRLAVSVFHFIPSSRSRSRSRSRVSFKRSYPLSSNSFPLLSRTTAPVSLG